MGLSIVQAVAEAHRGKITFESTPGGGTTFEFQVPLREPSEANHESVPEQPTSSSNAALNSL